MAIWDTVKKVGGAALGIPIAKSFYDIHTGNAGTYTPATADQVYWGGDKGAQGARVDEYGRRLDEGYGASQRFEQAGLEGRGLERQTFNAYEQMSRGEGPSVARQMAMQGANTAQMQANQMAASARGGGGNQLLAQRMAQQTGAQAQQQASATAAQLGQQEQLAAMSAMGDMASRLRAGDARAQEMAAGRGRDFLGARQGVEGASFQGEQQRSLANMEAANMANQEQLKSKREARAQRAQLFEKGFGAASSAAKGG